jgi:hypothetical protein
MARIWKEKWDSARHNNHMPILGGVTGKALQAPTLLSADVYFVCVCSFTFEFHNLAQIEECLLFYSHKIQPTTRVDTRGGDHWEFQTWFEQLPLYLREEPKRKKVVAALGEALKLFSPQA